MSGIELVEEVLEGPSPISTTCKRCLASYHQLCDVLGDPAQDRSSEDDFDRIAAHTIMLDAQSQFKGWAVSIAALQNIRLRSSLDSRLQSALDIRKRVVITLMNLSESLVLAISIASGEKQNETWGPPTDSEDEESESKAILTGEISEIDELFTAIRTANRRLMRLSVAIRNSPARDDYLRAATRYSFDPRYDIGHVKEKVKPVRANDEWITERLGKAITRRRQYLQYRREHHGKLSGDWEEALQDDKETLVPSMKATTFVDAGKFIGTGEYQTPVSVGSQTSYEPTLAGDQTEGRLNVPPPPKMAFEDLPFEYGEPFLCPFCYTEQVVENKPAWKKHVFRDLKPYVCTFKECNLRMFKSRNEWFAHEIQNHRREWLCPCCEKQFYKKAAYSRHLTLAHYPELTGSKLEAFISQSEGAVESIPASACLFCDDWKTTPAHRKLETGKLASNKGKEVEQGGTVGQFKRHLGRHMEQLALFALPINQDDEVEDQSSSDSALFAVPSPKENTLGNETRKENSQDNETRKEKKQGKEPRKSEKERSSQRMNEYFIPEAGIDREVITADIDRYLGNDALVRPGVYQNPATKEEQKGYFVTAHRNLTSAMVEDLKEDSMRWRDERENASKRARYPGSANVNLGDPTSYGGGYPVGYPDAPRTANNNPPYWPPYIDSTSEQANYYTGEGGAGDRGDPGSSLNPAHATDRRQTRERPPRERSRYGRK